jgi:hypothetical protein
MEGLPVKLGAGPPKIDHAGLAAALGDRSDAAKAVNILRRRLARAIRTKEA